MCYYTASFFLECGHVELSSSPIADSRCSRRDAQAVHPDRKRGIKNVKGLHPKESHAEPSLPSPPATPPPITGCPRKLIHPLHTFRVKSLCPDCQEERDARVEAFEVIMRDDLEQRILARSAECNERGTEFGRRRLFRASTTLAMIMDPSVPAKGENSAEASERHSQAETLRSPTTENVGKVVDEFRRRVGWNHGEATLTPKGLEQVPVDLPAATPCSPLAARLSFAAFSDSPEGGKGDLDF
jgi:hypothetical protein